MITNINNALARIRALNKRLLDFQLDIMEYVRCHMRPGMCQQFEKYGNSYSVCCTENTKVVLMKIACYDTEIYCEFSISGAEIYSESKYSEISEIDCAVMHFRILFEGRENVEPIIDFDKYTQNETHLIHAGMKRRYDEQQKKKETERTQESLKRIQEQKETERRRYEENVAEYNRLKKELGL